MEKPTLYTKFQLKIFFTDTDEYGRHTSIILQYFKLVVKIFL